MAHLVETMAYANEVPWHGLGVQVPSDLSPEQMLEKSGLNWTVDKYPAFATVNGEKIPVGRDVLVRSSDHKVLDTVGSDWIPVQNQQAFDFFHEYCEAGDMEMHTAGSLRGGQLVWVLAKVKESFELFKGDQVDSYLLFTNPHKFGQCLDVRFTPIRVVCNNTITLALESQVDRVVRKNHRSSFNANKVKETLGIATTKLAKYKEMAAFLGTRNYTEQKLKEYFSKTFPVIAYDKEKGPQRKEMSKNAVMALDIVHSQPGAEFAEGTWWQAFNAVTYMLDHKVGRTADNRLTSAWFGPNKSVKLQALDAAIEYAETA